MISGEQVSSKEHLADHLIGTPHNEAASLLDRIPTLPLEQLGIAEHLSRFLNKELERTHGRLFRRFAEEVGELFESHPGNFRADLETCEREFAGAAAGEFDASQHPGVVQTFARIHAANACAVALDLLPRAYRSPSHLLRCLGAHLTGTPSLSPYEQLLAWAAAPDVVDLNDERQIVRSDADVDQSTFVRRVDNHYELCVTRNRLASLVRHVELFLIDRTISRILRPDSDHQTRQVRVRMNKPDDRLFCFQLPWPVQRAA